MLLLPADALCCIASHCDAPSAHALFSTCRRAALLAHAKAALVLHLVHHHDTVRLRALLSLWARAPCSWRQADILSSFQWVISASAAPVPACDLEAALIFAVRHGFCLEPMLAAGAPISEAVLMVRRPWAQGVSGRGPPRQH